MRGFKHLFGSLLGLGILLLQPSQAASAYTLKTIYSFCSQQSCTDGYFPRGALTMDPSGNLYGVAGGYTGEVFEISPNGGDWNFQVLYDFCANPACTDGYAPNGKLVIDTAGNLYGTTSRGGANGGGTAFKLSPGKRGHGWKLQVLTNFCFHKNKTCSRPAIPSSGLTYAGAETGALYDGASPLYGTTEFGGPSDNGTAYRLILANGKWSQHLLYGFCGEGCPDGGAPGNLLIDAAGHVFGTLQYGGSGFQGTAFELAPNGHQWSETVLYNFCSLAQCADGRSPGSTLVPDDSGNLFGVTQDGGSGTHCGETEPYCGTLFQLAPKGADWKHTVVYNFCSLRNCGDGAWPSGIAIDGSGRLFGTTAFGGKNKGQENGDLGAGTVFSFDGKFRQLYNFCAASNCTDGEDPYGDLAIDPSGNLFGVTGYGGSGAYRGQNSGGTIFELVNDR